MGSSNVLPIAPSTYHAHVAKRRDPSQQSARRLGCQKSWQRSSPGRDLWAEYGRTGLAGGQGRRGWLDGVVWGGVRLKMLRICSRDCVMTGDSCGIGLLGWSSQSGPILVSCETDTGWFSQALAH